MLDTTTSTTKSPTPKTLSAVIVTHATPPQAIIKHLKTFNRVPDEIIVVACCVGLHGVTADIKVQNVHRDDFGQLARDIGLRLATKDMVMFVNTDDEYDPEFTEKLLAADVQLAYCDWNENDLRIQESYVSLGTITSGNFIVDRELAQSVGWNHRDYIADGRFVMEVMERSPTYTRIPEVLYTHR